MIPISCELFFKVNKIPSDDQIWSHDKNFNISKWWLDFLLPNLISNPVHNPSQKISADGWVPPNISTFLNISHWTLLNVNASITGLWDTQICREGSVPSGLLRASWGTWHTNNQIPQLSFSHWKIMEISSQTRGWADLENVLSSSFFITLTCPEQLNNTCELWEWALKLQPCPDVNSLVKVKFEEKRSSSTKFRARVFLAFLTFFKQPLCHYQMSRYPPRPNISD